MTTAAAALLVCSALQPGATLAEWSDQVVATPPTTTAGTLAAAPVQCQNKSGLPILLPYVVVSWTPTTHPIPLTYEAAIEERPLVTVPLTGSTAEIRPVLLSSVLGEQVTLLVTGRLPGTSWKTEVRRKLVLGVAGASVSCGAAV